VLGLNGIYGRVRTRLRPLLTALPTILDFVFDGDVGREYGVGVTKKLSLLREFRRNARKLEVLSSGLEHLELAAAILRIPRSVSGDVIECGCYQGGSSTNLSLTCALVGRRLIVCDSFEGLPEPKDYDHAHESPHAEHTDIYYEGRFAASLELVKSNIERCGRLDVCDFIVGFFDQTLPGLDRDVAMAFLDVDLIDSLKPCLLGIWPKLDDGSRVYVHEARSLSFVSIFFDAHWWSDSLGEPAPGFIGAGTGLPLAAPAGSELGYAQKGVVAARLSAD
jgi:O-methyltransferase